MEIYRMARELEYLRANRERIRGALAELCVREGEGINHDWQHWMAALRIFRDVVRDAVAAQSPIPEAPK